MTRRADGSNELNLTGVNGRSIRETVNLEGVDWSSYTMRCKVRQYPNGPFISINPGPYSLSYSAATNTTSFTLLFDLPMPGENGLPQPKKAGEPIKTFYDLEVIGG